MKKSRSPQTSMVCAEHYNALKLERDQLAARAKYLEEFISSFCGKGYSIDGYHLNGELELFDLFVSDERVLDSTPAQSLLLHDAEVLEKVVTDCGMSLEEAKDNDKYVLSIGFFVMKADQLRKQAEEI